MDKTKALSGGFYSLLGMAFLTLAAVGLNYLSDPSNITRPFLWDPSGILVTKHQAGLLMVGLGLSKGLGLSLFGGYRYKYSLREGVAEP